MNPKDKKGQLRRRLILSSGLFMLCGSGAIIKQYDLIGSSQEIKTSKEPELKFFIATSYVKGHPIYLDTYASIIWGDKFVPLLNFRPDQNVVSRSDLGLGDPTDYQLHTILGGIYIRWYSKREEKFWEASVKFDSEQIYQFNTKKWNGQYWEEPDWADQSISNSSQNRYLTLNFLPQGKLLIYYFTGDDWDYSENRLIKEIQAKEVDINWLEFVRLRENNWESKSDFVKYMHKTMNEKLKNEIKQGKYPLNGQEYLNRLKKYQWRLILNKESELLKYSTVYVNGELLHTYPNDKYEYLSRAAPSVIRIRLMRPGLNEKYSLHFDENNIQDEMEKISKKNSATIDLVFNIIDRSGKTVDVYLTNGNERVELKLDVVREYSNELKHNFFINQ